MRILKQAALFLALFGLETIGAHSNLRQLPSTPVQPETVSIYITAATKKGMLVRDLKPEDITITEDKVPAKIEKITCGKPEPLVVGVLVDVSGSRGIDPFLSSHYDALAVFLNRLLGGDDGAYLVGFDDEPHKLSEFLQNGPDISAAFDTLKEYQPRGSTALYDGIKEAAEAKFKGRYERRILVVLGDWEDNSSHIRLEDAVRDGQRSLTAVYAIVDGQDGYKAIKRGHKQAVYCAQRIAEETGGLTYDVYGEGDFSKVLQAIGDAVAGSCRVEYTTAVNAQAKKGIKVRVEANSKDVSVVYPRVRFGASQ